MDKKLVTFKIIFCKKEQMFIEQTFYEHLFEN